MKRIGASLCLLLPALLALLPVRADAHLVLQDGQVLSGQSVMLEGDLYLLTLEDGDVLALPESLVREVHRPVDLTQPLEDAKAEQEDDEQAEDELAGLPLEEPATTGGESAAELTEESATFELRPSLVSLPEDGEDASYFARDLIESDWLPGDDTSWILESGFEDKPLLGDLDTSIYQTDLIGPYWDEESGFEWREGEPLEGTSRWRKSSRNSTWKPKSGFDDDDDR